MARRTRRPCLQCGELIRRGSYCEAHRPRRTARPWRLISSTLRAQHVAEFGLVCLGLPPIGHAAHPVADLSELSVHHLIPIALGGSDDLDNLVVVCGVANSEARGAVD